MVDTARAQPNPLVLARVYYIQKYGAYEGVRWAGLEIRCIEMGAA